MSKVGKVQKRTQAAVKKWKASQTTNHQGYYACYYCGKWVRYLMAEHYMSKVRRPDLRTDHSNLVPTCSDCNENKRSQNGDEFKENNSG